MMLIKRQAVQWAVGCGVDIISMSWSIESSDKPEPSRGLASLEVAIKNAAQQTKPILMFCAASDQGNSTKFECYPAKWGECLRIGAATATGEKSAWVHGLDIDMLLPGENV